MKLSDSTLKTLLLLAIANCVGVVVVIGCLEFALMPWVVSIGIGTVVVASAYPLIRISVMQRGEILLNLTFLAAGATGCVTTALLVVMTRLSAGFAILLFVGISAVAFVLYTIILRK